MSANTGASKQTVASAQPDEQILAQFAGLTTAEARQHFLASHPEFSTREMVLQLKDLVLRQLRSDPAQALLLAGSEAIVVLGHANDHWIDRAESECLEDQV